MSDTYAAIEMARGETPHGTVHRFMKAAVEAQVLFQELEVLGTFEIGTRKFVRFRMDRVNVDHAMSAIRKDRAVITLNGQGYKAQLPDGRVASIPTTKMHMVPSSNLQRVYRGPGHELWKAQFSNL